MPSTKKQPKARAPKGSSTRGQPKARGKGSPGGKKTRALTRPRSGPSSSARY